MGKARSPIPTQPHNGKQQFLKEKEILIKAHEACRDIPDFNYGCLTGTLNETGCSTQTAEAKIFEPHMALLISEKKKLIFWKFHSENIIVTQRTNVREQHFDCKLM